jgi:hypothetical protein
MAGKAAATIDFGSTPIADSQFTVTDANITSTTVVEPFVQITSTADNDTDAHRFAAVSFKMAALPASGSFTLYITCLAGLVTGTFSIQYAYA